MIRYTGTLTFKVSGKQETAEVTIAAHQRNADAGGGWECSVEVKHGKTSHLGGFFAGRAIPTTKQLTNGLQVALRDMPSPINQIDVKKAGFKPKLVG